MNGAIIFGCLGTAIFIATIALAAILESRWRLIVSTIATALSLAFVAALILQAAAP